VKFGANRKMSLRVCLATGLLRLAVIGSARGSCCLSFQIAGARRTARTAGLALAPTGIVRLSWNTLTCYRQAAHAGRRTLQRNKKLAGSIASPANEIVACRHTIRKRRLAPAASAPRCTATCACYPRHPYPYAKATTTTSDAASAGSASTASAAATTTASAEASASASPGATTSAATASARQLHAAATDVFVVEEMEGGEADVGKFLFTERDHQARCGIRSLLNVARRYNRCRCTSRER
jgi:hypothetical protein